MVTLSRDQARAFCAERGIPLELTKAQRWALNDEEWDAFVDATAVSDSAEMSPETVARFDRMIDEFEAVAALQAEALVEGA